MILVTCAGGKTGKAIVNALVASGQAVRAMVRSETSANNIKAMGVAETVTGDLANAEDVIRATNGVAVVYYIAPNMDPNERLNGDNVIAACQSANVSRLVFHSVLHTQLEALPHHWERHFVEQSIVNSKLSFTILQVGSYMQNMLPAWEKMVETGVHRMAYDIDAPMSLVDLSDVAEAAVKVIADDGYANGMFEVAGPVISLNQKVAILSKVLGKEIVAEKEPLDDFLDHGRAIGFSDFTLATMAKMFPYYDDHGLVGSDKALGWILGRAPTDFETFARRTAAALNQGS
ncbi:MAG: NAD(P)H-binding protein [Alphaproteobacteria bacterium]|nr:NAD(P)H-binding protein [Alphaproteobacteria bacterium]